MGRTIVIANQKGGVGKTTTAINLSASLAEAEKKVLVIDIDPQGNTTSGFGIEKDEQENTIYELLLGECEIEECMIVTEFDDLTIIPSFPSVYNMNNGKIRLGECMLWVIESIRQGTPPSLGCKMVLANAENYEAIYFLTDEEVLDAAACYRSWWEERQYPKTRWTIDPCYDEPLCGSGYRWW